jgi:DNA invertase Pin-like site-specific DNA recombinase
MKSAYLYIRVSTDEQKRKGYSLPEQEDRLVKHCDLNDIEVKGIFREDYSAKNFNRPEWKKLLSTIKKGPSKEEKNILFIKWDRFSRNIAYAYEMINILRTYNTAAMSIDQPIDFTIPESTVMLAVYLSIPEAENTRRVMNTSNGIRRAKMMGRYPGRAPLGFINFTGVDGKKYILPNQPDANIIKWSFKQIEKRTFKIGEVRKMACDRGLICSKSNFSKIIRNPVYCGLIPLSCSDENSELIKGVHEPLVSESLFYKVQDIINTKRKITCKSNDYSLAFILKGFLICPKCGRNIRASFSQGSTKKHPYYHCSGGCKTRINAGLLNDHYISKLQQLQLSNKATDLFLRILEEVNVYSEKTKCLNDRKLLIRELESQQQLLSRARRLFVTSKLKFDDFREIKKECQLTGEKFGMELTANGAKLKRLEKKCQISQSTIKHVFRRYSDIDIADRKLIVTMISPTAVDFKTGELSLKVNPALAKILTHKSNSSFEITDTECRLTNHCDRKISIKQAIALLARNSIFTSETEVVIILEFLYAVAKTYSFHYSKSDITLSGNRTDKKHQKSLQKIAF